MTEFIVWIWIGLFVLSVLFEIVTFDLVSIWFAVAAIPSFIFALLGFSWVIQFISFTIVSIVLLLFTRPVIMKYLKTNEIKTNVDAVIGSTGIVISEIQTNSIGRVKVKNLEWSAISKESIKVGETVRVLDIEGVKLIVEKE